MTHPAASSVSVLEVVPTLAAAGWRDATPEGEHLYDTRLVDGAGESVRVQVRLQRKERGVPLVRRGPDGRDHHVVEVQRTRTGRLLDGEGRVRPMGMHGLRSLDRERVP